MLDGPVHFEAELDEGSICLGSLSDMLVGAVEIFAHLPQALHQISILVVVLGN